MGQVAVASMTRLRATLAILDGTSAPASPIASGGTVTIAGGYVYHTFTTNGTLTVYQAGTVDYLVVGGGGGGGARRGGGGGAGGEALSGSTALVAGAISVTIGTGGAGGVGTSDVGNTGTNGNNSVLGSIATANGGGYGGGGDNTISEPGGNGGNGGGAGGGNSSGGASNAAGGTGDQFNGGSSIAADPNALGGGGGGASAAGTNASGGNAGNGGAGLEWPASSGTRYGGGGGGGAGVSGAGTGGAGGGTNGAISTNPTDAAANTGGGGGGCNVATAGDGGSGIVIVRYPLVTTNYATGGTVTSDGTQIIHTFTAGGTFALAQAGLLAVDYLAVGGGGSSSPGTNGVNYGSGGAGGVVRSGTALSIVSNQTITIGAGGVLSSTTSGTAGSNGASSSIGSLVTATGGNGAGSGRTGGANADFTGETNSGGTDSGGGAGAGENGGTDGAGQGGDGVLWNGTTYGGGGGAVESSTGQAGGTGGGGSGSITNPTAGGVNTGGGGGGGPVGGTVTNYYGGSGIVIVRYSPGAFQPGHPLGFPDVFAFWDASLTSTITDTGGAVDAWVDRVASLSVTSSGAARPTTNATTQNGRNVVDFDGGDRLTLGDNSTFNFLHDGTVYTVFAVGKPGIDSNPGAYLSYFGDNAGASANIGVVVAMDDSSANEALWHFVTRGVGASLVVNNNSAAGVLTPNAWHCVEVHGDPANGTASLRSTMYIDAGSAINNNAATQADSNSNSTYNFQIGGAGNNTFLFVGSIGALIFADADISGSDRTAIRNWIKAYWGVTT